MFAARLQEDGAPDPTFGSGGTVITRLPPEEEETHAIPDQSIFAGALEARRCARRGVSQRRGPRVLPEESAESVASNADNSGYVYVDFRQESSEPPYSHSSYVAWLTPSGALDTTYGDNGLVSFPTARIEAIGVDPTGRLVVAGGQGEAVFLARLIGAALHARAEAAARELEVSARARGSSRAPCRGAADQASAHAPHPRLLPAGEQSPDAVDRRLPRR
jgi:hypothetical protein